MSITQHLVIDSHIHLWDLSLGKVPWLLTSSGESYLGNYNPLKQNYLIQNYCQDSQNYSIEKIVYIQGGWDRGDFLGEAEWVSSINDGFIGAMIAYANLTNVDIKRQLAELSQFPVVKGIRQTIGWHQDLFYRDVEVNYLEDPIWRKNFAILKMHDFVFDMQIFPEQTDSAYELIKQNPAVFVVIEHVLQPIAHDKASLQKWQDSLKKLARLPNVFIKLSGMHLFVHYCDFATFKFILETCIEYFSTSRCMFGSNFPVEKLYLSFDQLLNKFYQVLKQYTQEEQNNIFYETARKVYQI